jgi:nucleoside 2-deoxyribosyltransferase
MKVIYIAGPFRAEHQWAQEQNIRRAEELSLQVWRAGAVALCPHLNTRFFQGAAPDSVWLTGDLELLKRCDAILMVLGWEKSIGARSEREAAIRSGLPVLSDITDVWRYLKNTRVKTVPATGILRKKYTHKVYRD